MWYDSFINFFGLYSPSVVSYSGISVDGIPFEETIVSTDWSYVLSVFLFALVLYCLLRILGGMLSHGRNA